MRRAIVLIFHALLLVGPFAFTAVNDELFEFNKMLLVYAGTVIIFALWLVRMWLAKKWLGRWHPLGWWIGLWVLSQIIATLFSIDPHTSLYGYYSRFHGGLLSTLAYAGLWWAAISNLKKYDLPGLITTAVAAATGVALYAIPEHFGVSPSCVLITGEFTAQCWVQDVQTRVFATFGQPNWLAAYLLMIMPLTLWLAIPPWDQRAATAKSKWPRWWPLLSLVVMMVALTYTRSRSGFLALGLEWLLILAYTAVEFWQTRRRALLTVVGIASVIIGSCLLLLGTPFTPSVGEAWQKWSQQLTAIPGQKAPDNPTATTTNNDAPPALPAPPSAPTTGTVLETGGTDSGTIRRIVWQGAWDIWRHHPWWGTGVETFAYSYYQYRPLTHNLVSEWDFLYNKAHNEYLNLLATTGLIGLGSLMLMQLVWVYQVKKAVVPGRAQINDTRTRDLGALLVAAQVSMVVTNFFGFSTVMIGVLWWMGMAWWVVARRDNRWLEKTATTTATNRSHTGLPSPQPHWIVTSIILVAGLWGLLQIYAWWRNDYDLARVKALTAAGDAYTAYTLSHNLVARAPLEPVFWENHAVLLSRLAAGTAADDATGAAQLAAQAAAAIDHTLALNAVHLNFWKSRARVFLYLATIDPQYYEQARLTLEQARQLAPTDPKLTYNLALLYETLGDFDQARQYYEETLRLKPNYDQARESYDQMQTGDEPEK